MDAASTATLQGRLSKLTKEKEALDARYQELAVRFVPDGNPVVGYDAKEDGFFWLIGQGGYGIQSSPALSRLAAALVRGDAAPRDILDEGLDLAEISPKRFG